MLYTFLWYDVLKKEMDIYVNMILLEFFSTVTTKKVRWNPRNDTVILWNVLRYPICLEFLFVFFWICTTIFQENIRLSSSSSQMITSVFKAMRKVISILNRLLYSYLPFIPTCYLGLLMDKCFAPRTKCAAPLWGY